MEELQRSLGRIEGKLEQVDRHVAGVRKKQDDLDARLRKVEKMSTLYGAVAGGVIAFAIAVFKDFFLKK